MGFENNVFINCPFDDEYLPLLRPLLFTIIYLELNPLIASAQLDSAKPRIEKIFSLIKNSRYSVHDLSRLKSRKRGEFYRLNMPFELGVDVGCRFKGGKWRNKKCLILEAEKYRYQVALSDLSNSDIVVHRNEPEQVTIEIRNWLNNVAQLQAPGPAKVWGAFNDFMADNYDALTARGYSNEDIERLPVNELIHSMQGWVQQNPK